MASTEVTTLFSVKGKVALVIVLPNAERSSRPCDLSSKLGIESISAHLHIHETQLDILISNAGIRQDPPISCDVLTAPLKKLQESLWSSSYDDWTSSFQINTMAHYFLSVALVDLLAAAADRDMPDGT